MERSEVQDGLKRWKKTGGGSFHATIGGKRKIIKPGEIFEAREEEIPANFRDAVKPLDTVVVPVKQGTARKPEKEAPKEEIPEPPAEPSALKYSVQARSGGGYYDVVDGNGKVQNEKALRKDAAEALLKTLLGE